ncbi:group II intron maturase-specific domain-containing protein [Sinorhizobium meliloti]
MAEVAERLRVYVLGWKAYFRLAQTPRLFKELEEWMRHRVRAIQLKHWKRGKTTYKALLAKGAKPEVARQIAANSRRWWRNSGMLLNSVLTLRWMDALRIPRLA